jgi:hypothetical protein
MCVAILAFSVALVLGAGTASAGVVTHYEFEKNLDNSVSAAPDGTGGGDPQYIAGPNGLGNAIEFDGDDYVHTTTSGLPNSTTGLAEGSVAFWIKTVQTSTFGVAGNVNGDTSKTVFLVSANIRMGSVSEQKAIWLFVRGVASGGGRCVARLRRPGR